mgnify:FL=1
MKQIFSFIAVLMVVSNTFGVSKVMDVPQVEMVGARLNSLGVGNPLIMGDITSQLVNPAALGEIDTMPISFTHKKLLGEFHYKVGNIGVPLDVRVPLKKNKSILQRVTFGAALGQVSLDGIPETILDSEEVREVGQYSSGFNLLHLAAGTSFYDQFGFDMISYGSGLKVLSQFVKKEKSRTFGVDIGVLGVENLDFFLIDRLRLGGAIHNIFAPPIQTSDGNSGVLPMNFFVGGGLDALNERLSLYVNNSLEGVSFGSEYFLQNNLVLRGATDFSKINIGIGIVFEKIATILASREYSIRLDYNYTQNQYPMDANPNHMITFSLLGESRPGRPRIFEPSEEFIITNRRSMDLKGVGPKNTTIQFFNNGQMNTTTISGKYGKWKMPYLPLKEGRNEVVVQAYTLDKDTSLESNKIVIYSDTNSPSVDVKLDVSEKTLVMGLVSDEKLAYISARIGDKKVVFRQVTSRFDRFSEKGKRYLPIDPKKTESPHTPTLWEASLSGIKSIQEGAVLPAEMDALVIKARDLAGNETEEKVFPFFASVSFPKDKYVHYKKSIRFIGDSSDRVDRISINEQPVYIDKKNRFSIPIDLEPGKNLVKTKVSLRSGNQLNYVMRILRLKTFQDLNERVRGRREIEFLATLGVMDGEENALFYPKRFVTRQSLTKLIVQASEDIEMQEATSEVFDDVPASHPFADEIKTAVQGGLIFAFPDGTFRPEQPLTLSEAILLLSSAGLIESVDIEEAQSDYVTRAQLAEFLAYLPEYEAEIEALIDWETGYTQ